MRAVILIVVVLLFCGGACTTANRSPSNLAESDLVITDIKKAPIEYQLAYLDSGHLPRGNDISATRIRYLLSTISDTTGDSMREIADRTVGCTDVIRRKYGREVKNEEFLEEAKEFVLTAPKTKYSDAASFLVLQHAK